MLRAISPIDGRYHQKTKELQQYFSEYALIRYRVFVEIQYFIALCQHPLPQLQDFDPEMVDRLNQIFENFSQADAVYIKDIEKTTNHDVKAVEYFLKEKFDQLGIGRYKEFIHFGLTSQDVNNTATPLLCMNAIHDVYLPNVQTLLQQLEQRAVEWSEVPMLARTHGQPASPTMLGKEIRVFIERLKRQLELLKQLPFTAKFGGATGNFNAHHITYPDINWEAFADYFVTEYLGLTRLKFTTQIAHYDNLAALFDNLARINTICIDLCRDVWMYISMEYFRQKTIVGEIGSSAMPHKVNPIDFENAEGNLGMANAIFGHLSAKLPHSRLQRDLTDSTVLRNVGVPVAHTLIALKAIRKGIDKLLLNEAQLQQDLNDNWMVVAEAIQNILRREGIEKPYEKLLQLTRGKTNIGQEEIHEFIEGLNISQLVKEELKKITPHNYTGIY